MGFLFTIAVFIYAFWVFKINKPLLRSDKEHEAKAHYSVAALSLVFVLAGGLTSVILGIIALVMLYYRQPLINAVLSKVSR